MGVYYGFGKTFNFTPDQVDQLDNFTIEAFSIMGQAEQKEQERVIRSGRRR